MGMLKVRIGCWDVDARDVIESADELLQHIEDWELHKWEREVPHVWEPEVHPVTVEDLLEAAAEGDYMEVREKDGWVLYVDGGHPVAIRRDVLERARNIVMWVVWLPTGPGRGVWRSTHMSAEEAREELKRILEW